MIFVWMRGYNGKHEMRISFTAADGRQMNGQIYSEMNICVQLRLLGLGRVREREPDTCAQRLAAHKYASQCPGELSHTKLSLDVCTRSQTTVAVAIIHNEFIPTISNGSQTRRISLKYNFAFTGTATTKNLLRIFSPTVAVSSTKTSTSPCGTKLLLLSFIFDTLLTCFHCFFFSVFHSSRLSPSEINEQP